MIKLFGTTIKETLAAFKPIHLGSKQSTSSEEDRIKAIGRIIVTSLLCGLSFYLVENGDDTKDVGLGLIGTIVGYWLK